MTDNNNKIRALFLTALMVFSVFAGTIALTGTAAAVNDTDIAVDEFTNKTVYESSTTLHTVNFTVKNLSSDPGEDTTTITLPSGATVNNVSQNSFNGTNASFVSATGSSNKIVVTTNNTDNASFTLSATVEVTWPSVSSDTDGVSITVDDSDGSSVTVTNSGLLTITDTKTASAESSPTLVFQGQTVLANGFHSGDVQLRRGGSESSTFVRGLTADSTGQVVVDSSNLDGGETYFVTGSSTSAQYFEVAVQSLTVSADDGEVDNGGSDTTEELTIESNRGGEFNHTISSDDASQDELLQIFGSSAVADGEDDVALVGSDGTTADLNFSELDAGSYSFDVSVQDTTASDSFTVNVTDVGAGSATFANSSVEVSQGDIASVTIDLSEAATGGTFIIGSDDAGYQANISFTDGNDDGEVTVQFNTYTAGNVSGATVVTAADNDDTVTLDSQTDLANLLDDGEYELAVGTGDNVSVTDSPDDVGTVFLTERSTDSQLIWTAPGAAEGDLDADDDGTVSESEVMAAVDAGLITQDNTITTTDLLIHQVNATGLEGVIDANGGLMGAIESGSINVTVEQTNPGRNANPKVLNLSDSDTQNALTVVEAEGGFFIIIDAADADFDRVADDGTITSGNLTAADGDEFNATISVADDKLLGDEDAEQSVSANFEVESPMTELDSDPVNVTASNATISGTTNYAPGTELTVRARSTGDTQPRFFNTKTVTVQPDGTFNASFDFSAQSSGDTFGVTVRFSGSPVATADGNIMESTSTPTATATATAEPDGTETATATAAPDTDMATDTATNESDDDTETGTSEDTPGFGVAVALIALLAAALLAGRRE
ncbi:hypothetical protein Halar_0829 [halophilic archaeon DL31]|nr:hypothetical protein Halar_0829 [halophilic archaeon DL31]